MTQPAAISKFLSRLNQECPEVHVDVDVPRDPKGEWMLDIAHGKFRTSVAWRNALGFGIFSSRDHGIGDRPDEIYKRAEAAAARVCQLIQRVKVGTPSEFMVLKELRQLMETSQVDLAQAMQKNQAVISRLEGSEDMLLSSLVKYIQAMGGELELRAKFEDWEARIDPAPVVKSGTRG
jgi:hypothetical protein